MQKKIDRLGGLREDFRDVIEEILASMRRAGFDPWVYEGLRTADRQRYLYSIGRRGRRGEKPVTWTRHSRHQDGVAVDIISGSKLWNASEAFWDRLGFECKKRSLDWGGNWRAQDLPHVEI